MNEKKQILYGIGGIAALVTLCMAGCPAYGVYSARMHGKAELARAQYSKMVKVAEAEAQLESAPKIAAADTLRAHGVARANIIIGESLTDKYIHWYWVDELKTTKNRIIYIPTEGNMPLLEAGKRNNESNDERSVATEAK